MEEYQEPAGISDFAMYVILIIVTILVLCVLSNMMANLIDRISPDLRTISSGQAWLSIIPVFGTFWIFYVVQQTANMVGEEFQRRKIVEFETSPGLAIGWGFSFIFLCAQITLLIDAAFFTFLLYLGAIGTLIIYYVKLSGFKGKLDADLMRQNMSQFQQPFVQQPPHPFPEQQTYFPPPQDFPPQSSPPPADDWDRWKPR
jgi:hypothetical protein